MATVATLPPPDVVGDGFKDANDPTPIDDVRSVATSIRDLRAEVLSIQADLVRSQVDKKLLSQWEGVLKMFDQARQIAREGATEGVVIIKSALSMFGNPEEIMEKRNDIKDVRVELNSLMKRHAQLQHKTIAARALVFDFFSGVVEFNKVAGTNPATQAVAPRVVAVIEHIFQLGDNIDRLGIRADMEISSATSIFESALNDVEEGSSMKYFPGKVNVAIQPLRAVQRGLEMFIEEVPKEL